MSTNPLPPLEDTKVRVIFRGFFLAKITEPQPAKPGVPAVPGEAMIGAIDPTLPPAADPPLACHQPLVQVLGINNEGIVITRINVDPDYTRDFSLTVVNAQGNPIEPPQIEMFQKDKERFHRLNERENDKKDFRWFVDFDDLHDIEEPVLVNDTLLKPKFRFNKGVFHASELSDGEVRKQLNPKHPSVPSSSFGKFATEITARVTLDPGTKAIFKQGIAEIFTIDAGEAVTDDVVDRYEIVFDCECRRNEEEPSDFDLIYTYRLVTNVDETHEVGLPPEPPVSEKSADRATIFFNPEVYCQGGHYGGG